MLSSTGNSLNSGEWLLTSIGKFGQLARYGLSQFMLVCRWEKQ